MLKVLNKMKRPIGGSPGRRSRRVPRGMSVYAIGDIHGRADLLDELLTAIEADENQRSSKRRILVFLGDYIDRGSDSAGVVQRLIDLGESGAEAYFILGNHEEALLRIMGGDDDLIEDWLRFGGRECLQSYGADPDSRPPEIRASDWVRRIVPAAHRVFLEGCEDSVNIGDYLFVHAGIRPGTPLSEQRQQDLRWIRQPFLGSTTDHGAIVVHGHSICEDVDWCDNRIGIDTGAYRTGILTALVLSDDGRRILQTRAVSG